MLHILAKAALLCDLMHRAVQQARDAEMGDAIVLEAADCAVAAEQILATLLSVYLDSIMVRAQLSSDG